MIVTEYNIKRMMLLETLKNDLPSITVGWIIFHVLKHSNTNNKDTEDDNNSTIFNASDSDFQLILFSI